MQRPVRLQNPVLARPHFPGFRDSLSHSLGRAPALAIEIDENELKAKCGLDDKHQRVFQTVELFSKAIIDALRNEESKPDVWFVVIPDYVRGIAVQRESLPLKIGMNGSASLSRLDRRRRCIRPHPYLLKQTNLPNRTSSKSTSEINSRRACWSTASSTQVLREGTLENIASTPRDTREAGLMKMQSQIAWNIATTASITGGRPWKVDGIRKGVCYIGLVYKKDQRSVDSRMACCGAQMFWTQGTGRVQRSVGPGITWQPATFT